jgi:hypothetical protein
MNYAIIIEANQIRDELTISCCVTPHNISVTETVPLDRIGDVADIAMACKKQAEKIFLMFFAQ